MPEKRRVKIIFEYLGTKYAGWQWQDNGLSIQEVVENALEKIVSQKIRVTASGRTDAGVHALYQPVHCDLETRLTDGELLKAINAVLPKDVAAKDVETVDGEWHARFWAKEKTYRYTILNRRIPSVFHHGRVWHLKTTLDMEAMRKGAGFLTGENNFSSFQSSGCAAKSPVRLLKEISIEKEDDIILLVFTGSGFLKQMVRNITGTLVEAGRGKITPEDILGILQARDRTKAGPCAPAEGLCLMNVVY